MQKINMSEYRHLQMKKAEKPDYLSDPAEAQDRSWGNKLNVEVHAELLARPKSLCKKHKIGKREYKCTQQDLHQN